MGYFGRFTSFGNNVTVENSEIEHSMVLGNSRIRDIDTRIQDSLIGSHVEISRSPIKPKALKLALADYSQVGIL